MGIEITPEVESLVHGIYADGQYSSEAEVLAAALLLLQQRDRLRNDLRQGCDELDRGERFDGGEVFAELRRHAANLDEHRS
ncbi:MAG: CopG family transcriptional regulator [Planctomycetes bacterium]|nr:CopG family transcriptional regulator [Planctomycetota bacterium]